jgi:hypothetical protein
MYFTFGGAGKGDQITKIFEDIAHKTDFFFTGGPAKMGSGLRLSHTLWNES